MLKLPKNEGLNIVPFIDIMLVLLCIVLSISTFIAHGQIKVNLPPSEASQSADDAKDKLRITINADNVFHLEDKVANLDTLKKAVENLNKDTIVELKSDKDAKFESFVQVIDLLKAKEHENFQILTEKRQ